MHRMMLIVLLVCSGCSKQPAQNESISAEPETVTVNHVLPAFDGKLLGIDQGEWGGSLIYEDAAGRRQVVLAENVHGIIENPAGIFAFTGIAHLGINEGYIYVISRESNEKIYATMLGKLPGAPWQITQIADRRTAFLVYSGYHDNAPYFECYELTGRIVSPSNACSPPQRAW